MNDLKGFSVACCKALTLGLVCMVLLTNAFANGRNKNANSSTLTHFEKTVSASDSALIVQKCLDVPELQQYYPKNADGTYKQVYIMQFPVAFPTDMVVSKFNQNVLMAARGAIYAAKADVYLMFRSLIVSGDTATVDFDYNYNYTTAPAAIHVLLTLQKSGNDWAITNTQTTNR